MNTRRITVALGAAAGGLAAAAFLSTGMAHADAVDDAAGAAAALGTAGTQNVAFDFTANGTNFTTGLNAENVLGVNGMPPFDQDTFGFQVFNVGPTGGLPLVGTVNADVNDFSTLGLHNQEVLIDSSSTLLTGVPIPGSTDGSVFDTLQIGSGFFGVENVYADVAGVAGGNTITDNLIFAPGTALQFDLNLSDFFQNSPGAVFPGDYLFLPNGVDGVLPDLTGILGDLATGNLLGAVGLLGL